MLLGGWKNLLKIITKTTENEDKERELDFLLFYICFFV